MQNPWLETMFGGENITNKLEQNEMGHYYPTSNAWRTQIA